MSNPDTSPQRGNPFNRDIVVDERHYNNSLIEQAESVTILPRSALASPTPMDPTLGDTIPDADLGLSPDNRFLTSSTSSGMGLSREEELSLAIDSCKEMIVQSEPHTEKYRKLVQKLVQLRMQQQELQEAKKNGVSGTDLVHSRSLRKLCGHTFVLQDRSGRNPYCERCRTAIWRLIQPWYRCKICGYRTHGKCLDRIRRVCAGVEAKRNPNYVTKICPEQGLVAQKYRCAECRAKIAFDRGVEMEPRICDYSGLYFCPSCHWNDTMIMPARVIHNWDFEPYPVSRSSKQLLQILEKKPLLNLEALNPALLNYIEELRLVKKMRKDILLMKCYFMCCRDARHQRILWKLQEHQHFVEGADMFSLYDVVELQKGNLETRLREILDVFIQHIKRDCETCKGNGFICELCDEKEIIFPFDDYVSICRKCCAVFHRRCYEKKSKECSRCKRREVRALSLKDLSPDSSPERVAPATEKPANTETVVQHQSRSNETRAKENALSEQRMKLSQLKLDEAPAPMFTSSSSRISRVPVPPNVVKDPAPEDSIDRFITKAEKAPEPKKEKVEIAGLNPFEEDEKYDESLNPFGGEESPTKDSNKELNPFT